MKFKKVDPPVGFFIFIIYNNIMFRAEIKPENIYAFLTEFAFSLLFLIFFATLHYNFTKSKKFNKLMSRKKWFRYGYFFFFGAIISMVTFIVSQLTTQIFNINIGLPITIMGLIFALSFFYSSSMQIGAIIPTIFWVIVEYDGFSGMTDECAIRLGIVVFFALVSFLTSLFKNKRWLFFLIGLIILAGTYIALLVWIQNDDLLLHILEVCIGMLMSIVFLAIIKSLNKMFSNISSISKKATHIDEYFVISSLLEEEFDRYLKEYQPRQALVLTLDIHGSKNTNVRQEFFDNLHHAFKNDNVLYLQTATDKRVIVISNDEYTIKNLNLSYKGNLYSKRLDIDSLSKIEKILLSIPTKYTVNGKAEAISFKAYGSIYGVHSYDITELLSNNLYMINNENSGTNTVQLFNSNMINHLANDNINYATLIQRVNLEEITVELEKIQFLKGKEIYICPRFYWPRMLTCNSKEIMSQFDRQTANTLLRNLAIKSIELYENSSYKHKYKLLIYYPINELTSQFFSARNITKKLRLFGLNNDDVIFSFGCSKIKTWPYTILKSLKDLEKEGINYFLVDLINLNILKTHKPQVVILDESVESNKKQLSKSKKMAKQYNLNVLFTTSK